MKKNICGFLFLFCAMVIIASPVKRGQWLTITLGNGTEVKVEARGDEHTLFWQDEEGNCYVKDSLTGEFQEAESTLLMQQAQSKRISSLTRLLSASKALKTRASSGSLFQGQKKSLIILVQFADKTFSASDARGLYTRIANENGYGENGFNGSVRDYFLAQSNGVFDLNFDVVGPVTMPNSYSYYGNNNDEKVGELVNDACLAVDDSVNFSDYDWDKDGEVEEVFILYAGYGQADHSNNDEYIWPHMYALQGYDYYSGSNLVLDRTLVNVYACANELTAGGMINGIGTICHEFSHCLGFPDMYDTGSSGNYGMGSWDLMDYGCYNGDGFTPAGYTGYEKMLCGWDSPIVISQDTTVTGMQPIIDNGASYMIYNPDNANEYYILDNRQKKGFDAFLPGHGLLITHVDYDETAWYYNIVNSTGLDSYSGFNNTHQRATIFHADNNESSLTEAGDAYPYQNNNSLSRTSSPKAMLYNASTPDGRMMKLAIVDITEHEDGTMSFAVQTDTTATADSVGTGVTESNLLLQETFDQCEGTGGNDGVFKGSIASSTFLPDISGWTIYGYAYGGNHCARFGQSISGTTIVATPWFTLQGDTVVLKFRAAGWNSKSDGTNLQLSLNGGDAKFVSSQSSDIMLTMTKGQWTSYELKIIGSGMTNLAFTPSKRFFLDDVLIEKLETTTGINNIQADVVRKQSGCIYTLDGRKVGFNLKNLPHGIYIIDGSKVVK
ncbi:MAG: M6 family metalloprotease domain-containing protein [Prevotella sp.]|nr:M6 family metalloprotease domain-containing protein [Prevotella sp.]